MRTEGSRLMVLDEVSGVLSAVSGDEMSERCAAARGSTAPAVVQGDGLLAISATGETPTTLHIARLPETSGGARPGRDRSGRLHTRERRADPDRAPHVRHRAVRRNAVRGKVRCSCSTRWSSISRRPIRRPTLWCRPDTPTCSRRGSLNMTSRQRPYRSAWRSRSLVRRHGTRCGTRVCRRRLGRPALPGGRRLQRSLVTSTNRSTHRIGAHARPSAGGLHPGRSDRGRR